MKIQFMLIRQRRMEQY